jgi:serine/threonine protein kinase
LWSIGVVYYQLLYGDPPFFALDVPSLMRKINEGSGDNLIFHDKKNEVSDHSKDLLRRLLQPDPQRRVDWDSFFNHPVFSDDPHQAQDTNTEMFAKIVGNFLVNSKKVNDEFENHQKAGAGD